MISCNLQGGLGNQMFQIAATYALSLRNSDEVCFDFEKCHTPLQGFKSLKYQQNIFKNIKSSKNLKFENYYFEPKFSYSKIEYIPNLLLNGYFQSEKYFEDYKQEILNLFHISEEDKKSVNNFINSVNSENLSTTVIHVRRGDYLLYSDYHYCCPKKYFNEAMSQLGNCCYIFISDDLEWVKNNFKGYNIHYFNSGNEILDLTLMTQVQNVIISNSSFSWWGAYLNLNKNKKIIAPKKWFGVKGPKDVETLLPNEWIKI